MNTSAPWITFFETCKRIRCCHKTVHRLCIAGILVWVFQGVRVIGITIESVAPYAAVLEYPDLRERGLVPSLPWAAKDQSPRNYLLVTGHYPKAEAKR